MAMTPKELTELFNEEVEAEFEVFDAETEDGDKVEVEQCIKVSVTMPVDLWREVCKSQPKAKAFVEWCNEQLDNVEEVGEEDGDAN